MGIFELPSDFLAPIVQAMIVPPELTDATDSKIDTAHFTPHLKAAYVIMQERAQPGELPASFAIEALPAGI